jgi:pullulanase
MKDIHFIAKLTAPNAIRVILIAPFGKDDRSEFVLLTDNHFTETLKIDKTSFHLGSYVYDLKLRDPLVLGHQYDVVIEHFGTTPLDVTSATEFPTFDQEFFYDGNDLGCTYTPKATTFVMWAPLAGKVTLRVVQNNTLAFFPMERKEKGIYRVTINGDYELAKYRYLVQNCGIEREATDLYAKGSTQNGEDSVVIDFGKLLVDFHHDQLPPFKRYTDAIIYETSVRDITSDLSTTIVNKGRFLGMTEKGATTQKGYPAGFDYLVKLGMTHLQLMPIYDFKTGDEKDPLRTYNWGYDPAQYFVPEGSYASILEDSYSRIRDLKTLVSQYHAAGIRINMDVVYNHVFLYQFSVFEKVVPNFFFRRKKNGKMSDGSFCGNDVASERPMVRKMIVDACAFWAQEYGIDGYRFDLMGIIDIDTMRAVIKACRAIKPDFMLYGEGWDMPTELPGDLKSSMNNADRLPDLAFFNDAFRDIAKGGTLGDKIAEPGYLLGASNYRLGFKFAYVGSCLDLIFPAKFKNANQTINYVECHDNETFFDKLEKCHEVDDMDVKLRRVKLANAAVMFAFGVPFFHMGQEIGLSKGGDTNSYRSGDKVNKFDYRVLDERPGMALYFADLVKFRKKYPFLCLDKSADIENMVRFTDLEDGGLIIDYVDKKAIAPWTAFKVIINPAKETSYHELEDYYQIIFAASGLTESKEIYAKNVMVNGISFMVLARQ